MTVLIVVGLLLGVVVLGVVIALFNRVVAPAREIDHYAGHVLDAGLGICRNLDGADELERTRELGLAVPGLAVAYLDRVKDA